MNGDIHTRKRLAAVAAACLLTIALPAGTALAQKEKNKTAAPAATAPTEYSVEIPTIEAVDANLDEDTLRDIFSGNLLENAEALAGLNATSITIPELTVSFTTGTGEQATEGAFTLSDIVLSGVADGVAASITMAGSEFEGGSDGSASMGAVSANEFDIGGVLALYGFLENTGETELTTIYKDFSFAGGTVTAPEGECTIGAMTAAEFKARPLRYSFGDVMAMSKAMEAEGDTPSPQTIGTALRIYADMFTAFESSPIQFDGFNCDLTDDQGNPMTMAIASMSMDGFRPGFYPAITMEGMDISVEGDGQIGIGSLAFKQMDLTAPINAIEAAPEVIDQAWLEANARSLIPAFAGISLGNLSVDVPDMDVPNERIVASVGAFDLTLGEYLNGIPTDISTSATNIVVDLPQDTGDETLQQLQALGVTSIDAGFKIEAAWNAEADTIDIKEISVNGADLANVVLTGTLGNATEALFGLDNDAALVASMGVVLKNLNLDVTDAGLSDIILTSIAAEQGGDAASMRPIFAGLAEGTVIGLMAGAAEAQKVGGAINAFVSGKAKSLSIDMVAKEEPGLGLVDFMAAEQDPTVLIGKVTINATAK
jgi:hypothetical protein